MSTAPRADVRRAQPRRRALRAHEPRVRRAWQFAIRRLIGQGDDAVCEVDITDGVQHAKAISFFSVEDGKIVRLVGYWPEPFAARADRAHLVETWP